MTRTLAKISLAAIGCTILLGCVSDSKEVIKGKEVPVAVDAPPPPPAQKPGDPPDPDAIWTGGHYVRKDGKWVWIAGYWRRP